MNAPLISIRNLSVSFNQQERDTLAVRNISFDIQPARTLAIVGESGSGKSVTALSILRLLPYPKASHPSGEIRYAGEDLLQADEDRLRQIRGDRIGMIFQEPMTSLNPLHNIERQISEVLWLHKGLRGSAARQRTLELLSLVGIPDPESRLGAFPHELSGGQRQRVMIAMALANEPELLIADEPTTALDVTIQQQILELLQELQQRLHMAVLLITHDLGVVRHYAQEVCVMHQGTIVEQGSTQEIFERPQAAYTRKLLNAEPQGSAPTAADAQSTANSTLLDAQNLRVWFPIKAGFFKRTVDYVKAVDDVSLQVRPGETLGVVGESGSGKSTLGQALLRLQSSQGRIRFDGSDLQQLNQKQLKPLRREMQIVFQDPYGTLSPRMLVGESIAEGLEVHQIGTREERDRMIGQVLEEVGLPADSRHRYPHEFSGGQRQRIAIARALVLKPKLIILDEPTSALDRTVQSQIIDLLRSLQERHRLSYIFISHDLAVVRALSHHLLVMRQGRIVEQGACQQVFDNPTHPYTQTLLRAALLEKPVGPAEPSQ